MPYQMPYFGYKFTNKDIEKTLHKVKLKAEFKNDETLYQYVATKLSQNKIIGWFQGSMEFGQRALGNRSIIASPANGNMKDIINNAVKYRENFRPFAPSIIDEKGKDFFQNYYLTPYMERVLDFKQDVKNIVPAVVHKDGTGRLQSVTVSSNEKYYNMINSFYNNSGIPLVLNTSFNKAGEPIVYSPEDAIKTFFTCGIDILILGNYIIEKGNLL